MRQILTASNKEQRKTMAVMLLDKIKETPEFLNLLWTSDEARFHRERKVNSERNVFWKPPCLTK